MSWSRCLDVHEARMQCKVLNCAMSHWLQLPHYVGLESVEGFFRQRFKQAMHLQHGSGNEGMNIVKATQMEIWEGVRTSKYLTAHTRQLGPCPWVSDNMCVYPR